MEAKIAEFSNEGQQGFSWFFLWWSDFVGGILCKIPIGTGGVLDCIVGLGNCIETFGGRFG